MGKDDKSQNWFTDYLFQTRLTTNFWITLPPCYTRKGLPVDPKEFSTPENLEDGITYKQ